jgi:PAS domain S-box-containing protein
MPVAFYRTSTTGELIAANPALATLLGFASVDEMMAVLPTVETIYMDPAQRADWLQRIATEGVILDFDVQLSRPDGTTLWVRDSARAIRDEKGQILYYEGSLVDVTDKFEASRAKDDFIATVSHELRNPLAAMLGLGQELADHYDTFTDEERRDMANMIARQADDASWLIEDLLVAYRDNMSQISVSIQELDMVKEIERVLEVVDYPIEVKVLDAGTMILADPRRTRQILRNLISNAMQYGGETIQVSLAKTGDRIEIRVQDSGPPIANSDVERIFRAYERGRGTPHSGSVGLGLNVARRLARLMDGDLTYRHEDGWSEFVLSMPSA